VSREHPSVTADRLRVLLVPDSIHWITGTIAKSIIEHNSWIDGKIISGAVLDVIAREDADVFSSFDLVHFVCPYASKRWLPFLRSRVPCVTSHHHVSDDWELLRHNMGGDAIVVGSSQWALDAERRGASPEKIVRMPYGVDASSFVPATADSRKEIRESLGICEDTILIGFFAKLSSNERDRKGTDIFAAAVRKLNSELSNLAVLVIGPGWDEWVSHLQQCGVNCVWIPFVRDAARMPLMYQALDFYWVTARVEGGPVTLLEAMSAGVCCISTPVGLANDLVEAGVNAVLVPFDDAAAFAVQTLKLAGDQALRAAMGTRARADILAVMDAPIAAQQVCQVYRVALEQFHLRNAVRNTVEGKTLTSRTLKEIAILEDLIWAEALIMQGHRALALKIMIESWLRDPLSSRPPRVLFRNLLPESIVRALVRVRQLMPRSNLPR
jgi:glycosyltransferase involved in cell wall biosynthesis